MAKHEGFRVTWPAKSKQTAVTLLSAFEKKQLKLTQNGTRTLWSYPNNGTTLGVPKNFGSVVLKYVCIEWDGMHLVLDLVGPSYPNTKSAANQFVDSFLYMLNDSTISRLTGRDVDRFTIYA